MEWSKFAYTINDDAFESMPHRSILSWYIESVRMDSIVSVNRQTPMPYHRASRASVSFFELLWASVSFSRTVMRVNMNQILKVVRDWYLVIYAQNNLYVYQDHRLETILDQIYVFGHRYLMWFVL